MFNPWEPNLKDSEITMRETNSDLSKNTTILHPYKSIEDVFNAIDKNEKDVFSKMSSSLKKNEQDMIKLISNKPEAYLYVDKKINNDMFKEKALHANPSVINVMPENERKSPVVINAYIHSMKERILTKRIDSSRNGITFDRPISKSIDIDKHILSNSDYEKSYNAMIQNGPYEKDNMTLTHDAVIVAMTRKLRPEHALELNNIEEKLWKENKEKIFEISKSNTRLHRNINQELEAIEKRAPEYQPIIEQGQKEYWKEHSQELARDILSSSIDKVIVNKQPSKEIEMKISEASKYIDIENTTINGLSRMLKEDARKKEEQKIQHQLEMRRKDRSNEYENWLIADCVCAVRTAMADGTISLEEATSYGYVSMSSRRTISVAQEQVHEVNNSQELEDILPMFANGVYYQTTLAKEENERDKKQEKEEHELFVL